jgi:uncharacterized lipoprotein NlpE involved in copper resistance
MKSRIGLGIKTIVAASLLTLSGLSFTSPHQAVKISAGISQSYIIFDNGQVAATKSYYGNDDQLKLIEADHLFKMPEKMEETKGNYFIDDDDTIHTVDANGYIYSKEDYELDSSIKHHGGNFFITRRGQLHIVRNDGIIAYYPDGITDVNIGRSKLVGGTYFISREEKLYVTTLDGNFSDKTQYFAHDYKDIKVKGHNYFITKDGTVYTNGQVPMQKYENNQPVVDSDGKPVYVTNDDGTIKRIPILYKYDQVRYKEISMAGGNFFFDNENNIHTISLDGQLDRGAVGRKLKVKYQNDDRAHDTPVAVGNNYFIYTDGAMFQVASDGYYYFLKTLDRRVGKTNFEAKINKKKKK